MLIKMMCRTHMAKAMPYSPFAWYDIHAKVILSIIIRLMINQLASTITTSSSTISVGLHSWLNPDIFSGQT